MMSKKESNLNWRLFDTEPVNEELVKKERAERRKKYRFLSETM